jgi:hypothetical protein
MVTDRTISLPKPNSSLWKIVIGPIGGYRNGNKKVSSKGNQESHED